MTYLRERIKWALFPGINLHARQRFHKIAEFLPEGRNGRSRMILDAGCGNGMLSYRCWQLGDSVVGVSIKDNEITNNRRLFNQLKGIDEQRMRFLNVNLYEIEKLGMKFDAIICTEVLEHISDDAGMVQHFWNVLNPGGVLHLCCPNAEHPHHVTGELDEAEAGGHVRPGYTFASYRRLLEPVGFRIAREVGLGGPIRTMCNKRIINAEVRFGFAAGFAAFALLWPLSWFDVEPRVPFSIYVQAVKPG